MKKILFIAVASAMMGTVTQAQNDRPISENPQPNMKVTVTYNVDMLKRDANETNQFGEHLRNIEQAGEAGAADMKKLKQRILMDMEREIQQNRSKMADAMRTTRLSEGGATTSGRKSIQQKDVNSQKDVTSSTPKEAKQAESKISKRLTDQRSIYQELKKKKISSDTNGQEMRRLVSDFMILMEEDVRDTKIKVKKNDQNKKGRSTSGKPRGQ